MLCLESEPWLGGECARVMGLMLVVDHCLMMISSKAYITIMNSVGARLSYCLTPVVYDTSLCSFPILNLTTLLVYNIFDYGDDWLGDAEF